VGVLRESTIPLHKCWPAVAPAGIGICCSSKLANLCAGLPLLPQVQEVPCHNTTASYRQYMVEAIAQDIKDTICRCWMPCHAALLSAIHAVPCCALIAMLRPSMAHPARAAPGVCVVSACLQHATRAALTCQQERLL
jgi:hypothetical protein